MLTGDRCFDLTFGNCCNRKTGLASLPDQSVDSTITDPPYSARTHEGQMTKRSDGGKLTNLSYAHLTPKAVAYLGRQFARVTRGWILVMTDHVLLPHWEAALGRYSFAPVPIVLKGMTVRMVGDGPSSWTIWLLCNRPIGLKDGTRPGAYVGTPGSRAGNIVKGAKPDWLMDALIKDYTTRGATVLDPFMGSGTTGRACLKAGRKVIGWEGKREHFDLSHSELSGCKEQFNLLDQLEKRAPKEQKGLF